MQFVRLEILVTPLSSDVDKPEYEYAPGKSEDATVTFDPILPVLSLMALTCI